jgi:hypothetical protein
MTISYKKKKIVQPPAALKIATAKIKSLENLLITGSKETLGTSELLLLQINSRENEILFI